MVVSKTSCVWLIHGRSRVHLLARPNLLWDFGNLVHVCCNVFTFEKAELLVQNIIFTTLLLAAASLWWLSLAGGSLWGSNYLPRPLSIVCIVLAIAARMNIKGENVSFGANPHSIGRHVEEE